MRSNPMIRKGFSDSQAYDGPAMTISGTRNKTFILVGITILLSIGSFLLSSSGSTSSIAYGLTTISSIGALILALITTFKPHLAKTTSILYAVCEGILLGSISAIFNTYFEGIAIKTVFLTLLSVVLTLAIYKHDPSIGGKVRKGVIIATLSVCGVSLLGLVFSLFGIPFIFWGNSLIGIGFSLLVVGVAIANLIVDYDNIAMGADYGLPEHMEWYFAFGLLVTIVWLYIELLQLLAKVASRD
nr:Bax inhibitor-1/YccA family protein [uncultured Niameybacter sp.]